MGAPDYYKSILLYGLYNGAPVPLACDAQGRLILALEPRVPFDIGGTVVLRDSFEDGLVHVVAQTSGADAAVALDNTEAMVGPYSCKLTGGSDAALYARIYHVGPPNVFTKFGLEINFRIGSAFDKLEMRITCQTGTKQVQAYIYYNHTDKKWQVVDYASGTIVDIITGTKYSSAQMIFYRAKLVVDIESECFVRLKHPGGEVNLSAYKPYVVASTAAPLITSMICVYSRSGYNDWVLIDDTVLTQDES